MFIEWIDAGDMYQLELDPRDRQILKLLQADCRISNADLAGQAGLSPSACWRKTRHLEEIGVIDAYRAHVVPEAVGLAFQALVHVQLTRHNPEHLQEFISAIETRPEVLDCYATTGQADYHLRVLCRDECRGLCPQCGQNLNTASCDCAPPADPRWDALAVLRDGLKS